MTLENKKTYSFTLNSSTISGIDGLRIAEGQRSNNIPSRSEIVDEVLADYIEKQNRKYELKSERKPKVEK